MTVKRFQLQIVDPGCPTDFVVELHRRLADHLDPEEPGLRSNSEIVLNSRPRTAAGELSEDHIETGWRLSVGNLRLCEPHPIFAVVIAEPSDKPVYKAEI